MPRQIDGMTRQKVIWAFKNIKPDAIAANGIRAITGVHPVSLQKILDDMLKHGLIECIEVKAGSGRKVYRWMGR